MLKRILWCIKLFFISFCILVWGFVVPLGGVIVPAFVSQYRYRSVGKAFLEQKYGEKITLENERLPLAELNSANFSDYHYTFKLQGKRYDLVYYEDYDYFCDNRQARELYTIQEERILQYVTDKDMELSKNAATDIQLSYYDWYVCPEWWLMDTIDRRDSFEWHRNNEERLYQTLYTGDNLMDFPVYMYLYYENVSGLSEQELQTLYNETIEELTQYDINCVKLELYLRENVSKEWRMYSYEESN